MTTPLTGGGSAWPVDPTMPSAAPDGYVAPGALPETVKEPPMTSAQIEARRNQFFELILQRVIEALTGFFSKVAGSAFDQLVSWANNIPGLAPLVNVFQGIVNTVTGVLGNPLSALQGILLNIGSALNITNLFGILQPHQIGSVTGGAISATPQNLISEGAFRSAITVVAGQGWSWDASQGRTIPGSLKVVADGAPNSMVSNQIPVVADEEIDFSVWVKWSGLTYTGTDPIVMSVTGYAYEPLTKTYSEIETSDLSSIASPAVSGGWQRIAATYTVPTVGSSSIPNGVRMRLTIGGNLTAGTVWWDEASALKAVSVSDSVVPGIGTTLDNIVNGLENLTGNDWTHDEAFLALFGQNATTIGLATRIALLESLQTPGASTVDAFERTSSANLGSKWTMDYTGGGGGVLATPDGHDASWISSGTGTRQVLCKLTTGLTNSTGDNQRILGVMGSKSQTFAGPGSHADGWNILIGRENTTRNTAILAYFGARGQVIIQRLLSGVLTTIGSTTVSTGPSSGSTIGLNCGTSSGARFFEATINNNPVLTCNDTTSGLGSSFRGWGFGAKAEGYNVILLWPPPFAFSGQTAPGMLNSWGGFDN